ncbi:hypothetical protein [Mycobacterium sp.]|uniref:hypothetical protein n=1 Tax=Mycobacterium sp. TaxID=1785 RepID=UPI003C775336
MSEQAVEDLMPQAMWRNTPDASGLIVHGAPVECALGGAAGQSTHSELIASPCRLSRFEVLRRLAATGASHRPP